MHGGIASKEAKAGMDKCSRDDSTKRVPHDMENERESDLPVCGMRDLLCVEKGFLARIRFSTSDGTTDYGDLNRSTRFKCSHRSECRLIG